MPTIPRAIILENLKNLIAQERPIIGGGAGMVMMVEPIERCIDHLKKKTYL